jgi:hypothetical protein
MKKPRSRVIGVLVFPRVSGEAPYTVVVVREPRAAPMSAEYRQQAVTAVTIMIHEW